MQVFFFLDKLQLETGSHRLVLKRVVVLNVVYQFLQQVSTIINLQKSRVLLLVRVDAGDLLLHVAILLPFILILRVEETTSWWLNFLVKLKHLDYICLLAITGSTLMVLLSFLPLLITEEIILGLVRINTIFMSLVLVSTRDAILVNASHTCMLLSRLQVVLSIGHDNFDSLEIFGARTDTLHELHVLALHILVTLTQLVILEGQFEYFLACSALCLVSLLPVTLVHTQASLHLGSR